MQRTKWILLATYHSLCYNVSIMIITYHGLEFVKLTVGDTVVAFNPPSKDSKYKKASFGADIALVSINHPDFNGTDGLSRGDKKPFIISGPGEYEIKGIFIKGFPSESSYDGKERINTIYSLSVDNMNICFLGAIGNAVLKSETKEALDGIDILFVPIAGGGVLSASEGYKLAVSLEPKLIIPIHFDPTSQGSAGFEKNLKVFLKEGGSEKTEVLEKLTIRKKDLEGKEGDIAVLAVN